MPTAGGHWNNLAECIKLSQQLLLPGVVETDIKRNNPIEMVPVGAANDTGTSIGWVKESTLTEDSVATVGIGGAVTWSEDVQYTTDSVELRAIYLARKLDKYVKTVYGNINNYEQQLVKEMVKGVMRKLGDFFFYGDNGARDDEWDGLHALVSATGAVADDSINIDNDNAGLSLTHVRSMLDNMKYGCDAIMMPYIIKRYLDQAYYERGLATATANAYAHMLPMITHSVNDAGRRVTMFDGIPIIPTDYLVMETDGSSDTQNEERTKTSSGGNYSVFFIKWSTDSTPNSQDPGVKFIMGHPTDDQWLGQFMALEYFDKLEGYMAKGFRVSNYGALLVPSPWAVGRICDVAAAAVTA